MNEYNILLNGTTIKLKNLKPNNDFERLPHTCPQGQHIPSRTTEQPKQQK